MGQNGRRMSDSYVVYVSEKKEYSDMVLKHSGNDLIKVKSS